jgi:acyl-[acyl carrier protein]--UDP-N-acetylglucosamine O-acyltransferase
LEEIATQLPNSPEVNEILDFVKNSERGIMKG